MTNYKTIKPRLLYVDDERINLDIFEDTFGDDYEIFLAVSGEEALGILRSNDIPLIIADQRMPAMTGVEFFEKIVTDYPDTIRMILTGHGDMSAIVEAINRGRIYYYFKKPTDANEVRLVISKALETLELKIELRKKDRQFRRTFEQAAVGIVHVSSVGNFLRYNRRFYETLGYPWQDLSGGSLFDIIHSDDLSVVHKSFEGLLAGDVSSCNFEVRVLEHGGAYLWGNMTFSLVHGDAEEPDYLIGVFEDISKRKQVEQELADYKVTLEDTVNQRTCELLDEIAARKTAAEELLKLHRAVEQSPVSVVITNLEGKIEYVNPSFTETTGYSAEEAIGKTSSLLKSGQHSAEFYKDMWATVESGKTWKGQLANRKKNGEIYWEDSTISPVRKSSGEITHYVAVKEDITLRKKAEEELESRVRQLAINRRAMLNMMEDLQSAKKVAEAATEAKSNFLANMSHEIRTPMNAVLGLSHLALATELTPKQQDYLLKIQLSAKSLLGIINDILDFSKIEAGKLTMESISFLLDDVLENVASLICRQANDKGVEIIFSVSVEVPNVLMGDPLRLGQVLVNLVSNALKFSDDGEVVVSVGVVDTQEETITLEFAVRDQGIGINAEQIKRLFDSFTQADTTTTRKYGGTGLGLVISKRLVELMGGKIKVESQVGKGSTFSFSVNLGLALQEDLVSYKIPNDFAKMRVLVVDASLTVISVLENMLGYFSFIVTSVSSGEEVFVALKKAAAQGVPYQLVLVDWHLANMNGVEIGKRILANPKLRPTPILIMMSTEEHTELANQIQEVGVNWYLRKPLTYSSLYDVLMTVFGRENTGRTSRFLQLVPEEHDLDKVAGALVLVVEDNEINQQVARELLESWGLRVSIAENGRDGVLAVQKNTFDMVFMDIQMPEMDGISATKAIRELDSKNRDVPIVAMTAHAMAGDWKKSIDAGMNDHITKPIEPGELFVCLLKWIEPLERGNPDGLTERLVDKAVDNGAEAFPDIPGVIVQKGLARMGGNRKSYRVLLEKFHRKQGDVVQRIREAMERGDEEEFVRMAHTLKGVAGNIGAEDLAGVVAAFEICLKKVPTTVNELSLELAKVEDALNLVLVSIANLTEEKPTPAAVTGRPADISKLPPMLDRLDSLLSDSDTAAIKVLGDIGGDFQGVGYDELFSRLEGLVGEYDFEAARVCLKEFVDNLK